MLLEDFIKTLETQCKLNTVLIAEFAQKMVDCPASTVQTMEWNGSDLIELGAKLKTAHCLAEQLVAVQNGGNGLTLESVKQHWEGEALRHGSMRRGSTDPMRTLVERAECIEICQLAKKLKDVKA